jgi:hypothetical protein
MIGAFVDQNNIVALAEFAAQIRGRHDTTAAAT